MLPRKCGPASFQFRRAASPCSVHRPLRVAIKSVVVRGARAAAAPLFLAVAMTFLPFARAGYATATASAPQALRAPIPGLDAGLNSARNAAILLIPLEIQNEERA